MKIWSETEKEFVRENYGKLATKQIAGQLKRKPNEVRSFAFRQGLSSQRQNYLLWTEEDEKLLREQYDPEDRKSVERLATQLRRTKCSILRKINRLGLTDFAPSRTFWTAQEDAILTEMAGIYSLEEIEAELRRFRHKQGKEERTRNSIIRRFQRLNLSVRVTEEDEYYLVSSLCKYCLQCDSSIVYDWIKRFPEVLKPKSVGGSDSRIGYYLLHHKNLRKFFLTYPGELQRIQRKLDMIWLIGLLGDK